MSTTGKLRRFLAPFYALRRCMRQEIAAVVSGRQLRGRLIDIGCGDKPNRDLFPDLNTYHGIDFKAFSANRDFKGGGPDFFFAEDYAQTWKLPFADTDYDHAAAFEVIEHHPCPDKFLAELARVIKPGGYVVLSWPLLFPLHEEPHDFQRLTHYQLERLCRQNHLEVIEIRRVGGLIITVSAILNYGLAACFDQGGWRKIPVLLAYPPFLALQYLGLLADGQAPGRKVFTSYVALLARTESSP